MSDQNTQAPVISDRIPYLTVELRVHDETFVVEALVDTGFDGDVIMPTQWLAHIRPTTVQRFDLADGKPIWCPIFFGVLALGDFAPIDVEIGTLAEEVLVGRGVTDRFRVTFDHGQRLIVEL